MIQVTQIKIPMEQVKKRVLPEDFKRGILTETEEQLVRKAAAKKLRLREETLRDWCVLRRSIDARQKQAIVFSYTVTFSCKGEERLCRQYSNVKRVERLAGGRLACYDMPCPDDAVSSGQEKTHPVVVGMGPAGLFAALRLAEAGLCPVVLERGSDVDIRRKKVEAFWQGAPLDTECNVQFGEGGAGTFSDGKLNTMVKDLSGRNRQVLECFVEHGAPPEILYEQKPHIGTDRLRDVVKSIRNRILFLGGTVHFDTCFTGMIQEQGKLCGIVCRQHNGEQRELACHTLVLALGHSARDTIAALHEQGLAMEPKAFAVGVRMEHPQELIGESQYGAAAADLPPASYKLTNTTADGRGVYSFCMCPGGQVVNASSESGRLVVNGMSNYARDGRNANSAIVVTVSPEDFGGGDVLAGIAFQRQLEERAFRQGNGAVPVQLSGDFLENRGSETLGDVQPDICGDYTLTNVRSILPDYIGDAIAESIPVFERRIHGFGRRDALMSGVETRTSSPVRIVRDKQLQADIQGVYPCGEGAGYAGGITSAAMDGLKVAEQIIQREQK